MFWGVLRDTQVSILTLKIESLYGFSVNFLLKNFGFVSGVCFWFLGSVAQ